MADIFQEEQQKFQAATAEWLSQMLQGIFNDPVIKQFRYAENIGDEHHGDTIAGPYRIMGLENNATDDQVKKRHRELAIKMHPDTAGIEGTGFLFQLVEAAYQQISRERGWQK